MAVPFLVPEPYYRPCWSNVHNYLDNCSKKDGQLIIFSCMLSASTVSLGFLVGDGVLKLPICSVGIHLGKDIFNQIKIISEKI